MRISGIAILAAVAFLSSANGATAAMAAPNLPAMARSLTAVQHTVASKRMLRFASPHEDDEDEEERGITAKLKGLAESVAMHSELKDWLKKGETVDKVLENLKLTTGVGSILENPAFKHLDDYISMYKKKFPHSGVTMIGTLTKRYDDTAVARALEAGKWSENKATNELAKKLQGEQFRLWLENEQSPLAIFKLLGLNSEATHPLQGYTFKAWQSYLAVFNKRLDGKKIDELAVFKEVYGDRGLANLLLTSSATPEIRSRANVLQRAQFTDWYQQRVRPKEVFSKVFKLDDAINQATPADHLIVAAYKAWWKAGKTKP